MTSLTTATQSFHVPQHAQFMHLNSRIRRLEFESSYGCAEPGPQVNSYFNPVTNETSFIETEAKVTEMGVLFYYEIRHATEVSWESSDGEEESDGWIDKAGNFFGGLFGGDDEESEGDSEEGAPNGDGGNALAVLEQAMTAAVWENMLEDSRMTWTDDSESECAGLLIGDNERQLEGSLRQLEGEDDGEVGDDSEEQDDEENDDGAEEEDAPLRTSSAAETKLLGLTHQPLDAVNPEGCTVPDSTCTSITGQISIAYSGINEYGAIQAVIEQLQTVMESGAFIPSDSPALNVEFQKAGGTAPPRGAGVIMLNTDRGTEQPEEGDISNYGVLFVCLVAILGTGFCAAMYVRYRKRQRKAKEANNDGIEGAEADYEANLAMQEEAMRDGAGTGKTDSEPDSRDTDSPGVPRSSSIISQVELEVPPVDSGADDGDIEISLPAARVY